MNDVLIYAGIGINIIGDLFLMAYGIKFFYLFRKVKRMPQRVDELKAQWQQKRQWGFGLIFAGIALAIAGCLI